MMEEPNCLHTLGKDIDIIIDNQLDFDKRIIENNQQSKRHVRYKKKDIQTSRCNLIPKPISNTRKNTPRICLSGLGPL